MDLTKQYFYRKKINNEKLINYGFFRVSNGFSISKNFFNDDFAFQVTVRNGVVDVLVFDNNYEELYPLVFMDNVQGEFVGKIREALDGFLRDISNKCFDEVLFPSEQANRIAQYIKDVYRIEPDFPWGVGQYETYGVYRNKDNDLWFGLIMDVKDDKLAPGIKGKVVINIKPPKSIFNELLKVDGIYPGWHMSKKSWLSVSLDDTLPDEYVESLIDGSYNETLGRPKAKRYSHKRP